MSTAIPRTNPGQREDGEKLVPDENTLLKKARKLDRDALAQIHDLSYAPIYRYISFRRQP